MLIVKILAEVCSWNVPCLSASHNLQHQLVRTTCGECCSARDYEGPTGGDIDKLSAICTRKTGRALLLLGEEDSCEGPFAVAE